MDHLKFIKNLTTFYTELYDMIVSPNRRLIRLGAAYDGGYLIPEDLSSINYCFSPGVSDMADFELDCARIYGMPIFMCDHTVESSPIKHPLFHFLKKGIGYNPSMRELSQPVSHWVNQSGVGKDAELLLQMDIEGAEYDFFLCETASFLKRFRYIIFEMHYLHLMLSEDNFKSRLMPFLKKIQTCFDVVHIHPNTSTVFASIGDLKLTHCLEITLGNKSIKSQPTNKNDRSHIKKYEKHPLDAPNFKGTEDINLPDLDHLNQLLKIAALNV